MEAVRSVNQATDHLSDAQIEAQVTGLSPDPAAQERLDAHLADCATCLERLLAAERTHLRLLEGDGMKRDPYPGCPTEETLQELAAGICAPETAESATEHAAHCSHCGPLLGQYLKEFTDEPQAEDAPILRQLKTSEFQWQKKYARRHLTVEKAKSPRWFGGFWPKLVAAAAGFAVAVGLTLFLRRPDDLHRAQELVASAYGERRTIEMRLTAVPYAPYAPLPMERTADANSGLAYQRPSLLKAGAAVGDRIQASSNLDPHWLQVKGRVALLGAGPGSAQEAQRDLEKAQSEGVTDASLKIDLAASYFEAASNDDHPDFLAAINLLRSAVDDPKTSREDRLVALFDLAVVYQKSKMFDLAVKTWEQYLQLDPSGKWADEARKRLDSAQKALPSREGHTISNLQASFFF
jgi:hypothetical protein